MLVSSTIMHHIVKLTPTTQPNSKTPSVSHPAKDSIFSRVRMNMVRGFDISSDSIYATSPFMGHSIVQLNATSGELVARFEDEDLVQATDVKLFQSRVYVCARDQVRIYDQSAGSLSA